MRIRICRLGLASLVTVALAASVSGCGKERVSPSLCRQDADCASGLLCEDFQCVPASSKSCQVVTTGTPVVQATPHLVTFGDLDRPEGRRSISLYNLGDCTLTLYEAAIAGRSGPFGCTECAAGVFPIEIFPNRSRSLEVTFRADEVGTYSDALSILSDDREYPEMRIPIHARYIGSPRVSVAPNALDFGYVAQGRVLRKPVIVTNTGTGTAPVTITGIRLEPSTTDFELVGSPSMPMKLVPVDSDRSALITMEVVYHPRSSARHGVDLVVTSDREEVRVDIRGTAETPPRVSVSPASIDLGQVPLGTTNVQVLTLVNEGGAPLRAQYLWSNTSSTDFWATPANIPDVAAGQYTELRVAVTATRVGPIQGMVLLSSNDPNRSTITIPVSAQGAPGGGPEVVKVEMFFENGSNSVFDDDIRNVDMSLEHPYGYVCNKQNKNPTNWGVYGTPTWISFGPKEEPERIILADAQHDGTYRVMLQYMEDCSALPTALLAGILGISVDVLIAYLTGGLPGPINGKDVAELISKICLSHSRTSVSVRVSVNGTVVKEATVALGAKGDTNYAVDLIRNNGSFTTR